MAFTLQSDFTFSIPRNIKDTGGTETARIKRISADGVVPVVLRGTYNLNMNEVKPLSYICYKVGATLDTIVKRRIESISDIYVQKTGYVYVDDDDKTKIIGVGTLFSAEFVVDQCVKIGSEIYTIKSITDNTTLNLYSKVTEQILKVTTPIYSIEYIITLMNTNGEDWDDYPTSDTLCMIAKEDNVRYLNDNSVECYYKVQSASASQLVYDIDYTPDDAVDLGVERSSYRHEITRERVRLDDTFNPDSYINEAKDTSSTITQNVYTWSNVGANEKISLRHEFNITLVDQLLKIRLYPKDMDFETGVTALSDWTLKIDVRENTLGKRYNTNFVTV